MARNISLSIDMYDPPPLLWFVLDLYNGYKAIYNIPYNSIKKDYKYI
jgi:hypothetical protein